MRHIFIAATSIFLLNTIPVRIYANSLNNHVVHTQFDKTTMIKKKIADAKIQIANGNFPAAINTINSLLRLDPNNEEATILLRECESGITKQKEIEYHDYLKVCKSNSTSEMESFLAKYPQSQYSEDVKKRIADNKLWQKIKCQNTLSAYQLYLTTSSILAYKSEANEAISILQSNIAWDNCKDSNDEYQLSSFIQKYPSSPNIGQAKYKLNILKGEKYFSSNDYRQAYDYLDEANRLQQLTGIPAQHLNELIEQRKFNSILSNSNIYTVRKYLNSISVNNSYYQPTSNHLALLLGASLTQYSSDESKEEALLYAMDNETKEKVRYYIKKVNEQRKHTEHIRLIRARKAWWKNRFMLGWNTFHIDYLDDICSVGTGIKFRFGRWSDAVNLIFGAEYAYNMYVKFDEPLWDDESVYTVSHQTEIPVGLRFNLFHVGDNYKFYIGCNANWGFTLSEGENFNVNKRTFAIDPQIGIAGNNIDFGIYYKKYLGNKLLFQYSKEYDQRFGCFLTWFF